jgi:hypothetical protein
LESLLFVATSWRWALNASMLLLIRSAMGGCSF